MVEWTVIFQSLSLKNQRLKNRNNPILYTIKKILIRFMLVKFILAWFQELLRCKKEWDYRNLTHLTGHKELFLFYNMIRGRFDNSYWCRGCTWDDRQLTHKQQMIFCLFHNIERFVRSYWYGEGGPEMKDKHLQIENQRMFESGLFRKNICYLLRCDKISNFAFVFFVSIIFRVKYIAICPPNTMKWI